MAIKLNHEAIRAYKRMYKTVRILDGKVHSWYEPSQPDYEQNISEEWAAEVYGKDKLTLKDLLDNPEDM